eukprot:CAMPEP_0168619452 /NCGR_PEP_ID=MMETSP0449_2-20121227/6609_1 /TAXON_ID=1082188 /ORGANISM="Strombidium rassoulzadegani, Strain ras09" /LENGTH=80 /DNA_ID=CAMNT_0008660387 /DNA_START=417 /DNA_END=656 /DNA_ORIENTATION=+
MRYKRGDEGFKERTSKLIQKSMRNVDERLTLSKLGIFFTDKTLTFTTCIRGIDVRRKYALMFLLGFGLRLSWQSFLFKKE